MDTGPMLRSNATFATIQAAKKIDWIKRKRQDPT